MAAASAVRIEIDLARVPLSDAFRACLGPEREARLFAASAGDDYELLFAAPPERAATVAALAELLELPLTRIGRASAGRGLGLSDAGETLPLPDRLGWEHG